MSHGCLPGWPWSELRRDVHVCTDLPQVPLGFATPVPGRAAGAAGRRGKCQFPAFP
ncbi:hypothetical protein PAMC26510_05325 [Caballeronia sordidicola]|uniref:Uncharacterized protein n=1 Tax=Caballeronia sordidicola TaxID=196367 RepID=A0A242N8D6_CABSO|nr:hypothetical protein PAMC26510_05325 [Caballeronia sordidicola]